MVSEVDMKKRLAELVALESVADALHQEDLVEVLNEVNALSDEYISVLEFLMRPESLTCLVCCMLQEPTATAKASAAAARAPGDPPTHEEYATAFRAHWVLCASGFSVQLLGAMSALGKAPRLAIARSLAECDSRDSMTLEALARFLTAFMDQYSPQMLLSLFEDDGNSRLLRTFLESLLMLLFYEPLRDVLVRLCNELADADDGSKADALVGLVLLQLTPVNPVADLRSLVAEPLRRRMADDPEHVQFARMVFTCDLLTDLIHEHREGSLGYSLILSLSERELGAALLLATALQDLHELPTSFANESYALKVLNSLLQQAQCGCVAKAAFCRASAARESQETSVGGDKVSEDPLAAACAQGSPHEELPKLWHLFLAQLPSWLAFLSPTAPEAAMLQTRFKPTHVQLVYLLLPVLNVSCSVADTHVVRSRALDTLLELVLRFPRASILHCAIARLFIVALEDSPYMFGKELPAFRSATDPLRLHLLLHGGFDFVLHAFEGPTPVDPTQPAGTTGSLTPRTSKALRPPPAFLDVAISLDQALTTAFAHSPQLFMGNAGFERWKVFRLQVLLPTQTLWEEQYQPAVQADPGPTPNLAAATCGQQDPDTAPDTTSPRDEHTTAASKTSSSTVVDASTTGTTSAQAGPELSCSSTPAGAAGDDAQGALQSGPCVSVLIPMPASVLETSAPAVADVPTPLSALYSDEEKHMIRDASQRNTTTNDINSNSNHDNKRSATPPSSPPLALVIPAAIPMAST